MIKLRLAVNGEGQRIAELLSESGFTIDRLDWSEVYPHWLVAEENEEIIGCIQIVLSKPIGWLELLSLAPMGKKRKARTVKALVSHGGALLKGSGTQVAMGCVQDDMVSFLKVLEHRGVVNAWHGFVVAKRL